ncbi:MULTISPECIES: hypothetical protein [Deinococcus]|uniref:Helix-hairpin-helix domain-containing protein n=1 Tax=Deinococcus rufus TaxID=2136097 RepID=A0ABV7ZF87_9DEIO|nr:hypothetical protein [Deinococcus sp. AB2017081]WQE94047.1 hypothetical protein U2P90_11570 [Deinococcus sp. AB2017081]
MVKVTSLGQTFTAQGQGYGPFIATAERPYLEVPLSIALVSGAPVYEEGEATVSPEQVTAPLTVEAARQLLGLPVDPEGAGSLPWLRRSLDESERQRLDALRDRDQVQAEYGTFRQAADHAGAQATNARVALEQRVTELQGELDTARARIAELEGTPVPGETPSDVAPAPTGTPLVAGLPVPELLVQHGFDTMEKLDAGLVVPDGATESPVMAVTGIGKKSVEAYQKAVTDWKAESA